MSYLVVVSLVWAFSFGLIGNHLAGLPPAWEGAKPALIGGGALLDTALGLWLWWRPSRWAYATALLAMTGMTLLATWVEPGWWLHPFGPLTKNLPIAAILWVLLQDEATSPQKP